MSSPALLLLLSVSISYVSLDWKLKRQVVSSGVSGPNPSSSFSSRSNETPVQAATELGHSGSTKQRREWRRESKTRPNPSSGYRRRIKTRPKLSLLSISVSSGLFSVLSQILDTRKERRLKKAGFQCHHEI